MKPFLAIVVLCCVVLQVHTESATAINNLNSFDREQTSTDERTGMRHGRVWDDQNSNSQGLIRAAISSRIRAKSVSLASEFVSTESLGASAKSHGQWNVLPEPTAQPTPPTASPSSSPVTASPTSSSPTSSPVTVSPTLAPSSLSPTPSPTTMAPTHSPTNRPTVVNQTYEPTALPSAAPTASPSLSTAVPTVSPSPPTAAQVVPAGSYCDTQTISGFSETMTVLVGPMADVRVDNDQSAVDIAANEIMWQLRGRAITLLCVNPGPLQTFQVDVETNVINLPQGCIEQKIKPYGGSIKSMSWNPDEKSIRVEIEIRFIISVSATYNLKLVEPTKLIC